MGRSSQPLLWRRASIHALSRHVWRLRSQTIPAPLASDSKKNPKGSVFCSRAPSTRDVISYLYRSPSPTVGTNVSQMPLAPRLCMQCDEAFQPLKSPITLTCSALGAHTAKCTPLEIGRASRRDRG